MDSSNLDPNIVEKIKKLEEKFEAMGQDMSAYLDGLLHADYLNYWDYINLDTLLSLQQPRTKYPDEKIFIMYHQITELYFKLILWELEQLTSGGEFSAKRFLMKIERVNRYFEHLVNSFDIMVDGMEREQFLNFRMSLLPASGFQSAQYRLIEIYATDLQNLLPEENRKSLPEKYTEEELIQSVYWQKGATELKTGKKTLTLQQFEEKYRDTFIKTIKAKQDTNLYKVYHQHIAGAEEEEEIKEALREFDHLANVHWPLSHYKSAVRYLQGDPETIAATGGTNWQKYLPPRFQRIIFFPELWSEEEKKEWGKSWVLQQVKKQ
ncbi:tryptophan 2,3-dioxygenase family protein [Nafulsella turpanensis]|uniref:tryptophan 2,3-dioxygenase family protein n=1 Tax=Nafulsella turpanensis TaxID=1265690 RepID=UPI0003477632|nr:tryptophan 2,3-dioxygenase family protein [Nafulsella turpanensis]